MKENQIINLEAYWSERMCELVTADRIDDSDALYQEFVVDGEEPSEWVFLEDMSDI